MHISEGILSGPVIVSGIILAVAGTATGLKKLEYDNIPKAAILSAAFFVASLVHVPIGPSSVHLILNGIVGLLLGWGAFPAIMIALLLQAVIFQFGGITTLGINTIVMAVPAVICYYLFSFSIWKKGCVAYIFGFACGAFSVFLSAVLVGAALFSTGEDFLYVSAAVIVAHIPVMVIEGIATASCLAFLKKVQPELLPRFSAGTD